MTTLQDLLSDIDHIDGELVLYAENPLRPESEGVIAPDSGNGEHGTPHDGFAYVLEVDLVRDVLGVWSSWRGREPTPEQAARAVIYYSTHDAYLPVELEP